MCREHPEQRIVETNHFLIFKTEIFGKRLPEVLAAIGMRGVGLNVLQTKFIPKGTAFVHPNAFLSFCEREKICWSFLFEKSEPISVRRPVF